MEYTRFYGGGYDLVRSAYLYAKTLRESCRAQRARADSANAQLLKWDRLAFRLIELVKVNSHYTIVHVITLPLLLILYVLGRTFLLCLCE